MSGGGMIVRLIDICMILLFGFICCAELSSQSKISLPTTLELPASNPDPEMVEFVGVQKDGSYLLDQERYKTYDTNVLEEYLRKKKNVLAQTQYKMRVRLRANYDTPVRYIMAASDVCDRVDVLKSVDVRIGSKYTK
jgi:biopolymer transport protein ExbD